MKSIIAQSGDIGQALVPALAGCYALSQKDYKEAAALGVISLVQTLAIPILKGLFPKERPDKTNRESFPSGHTAAAFLGVGLLFTKYGFFTAPTLSSLAGATGVGLTRYLTKRHWPSDIAAGALIGTFSGALASKISSVIGEFYHQK